MDWSLIIESSLKGLIGINAVYFAIAAIGLNVQFGYTGLLNFGQVAFVAVGAYGVGVAVIQLGWNLWLSIVIALVLSVVLSLLLGVPTLRLRADYLAIVTIAASEIIRLAVKSFDAVGGSQGINGPIGAEFFALNPLPQQDRFDIGPLTFTRNDLWVVIIGWILIGVLALLTWALMRSPWGRILKGIREDEDAVRSLGKSTYLRKMQALVLGGLFGTLAGIFWAISTSAVQPDSFVPDFTFFLYTMLILGGVARVMGPVLGALIFWFLLVFIERVIVELVQSGTITFLSITQIGPIRFILVGLGLMALMIFRPQGILGDRKELALDAR